MVKNPVNITRIPESPMSQTDLICKINQALLAIDTIFKYGGASVMGGGSTSISSGVGAVKMSSVNNANCAAWIPIVYGGTTYYVPGWITNAP